MDYQDPKPGRISFQDWTEQFRRVPDELIQRYHYFNVRPETDREFHHQDTKNTKRRRTPDDPQSAIRSSIVNRQSHVANAMSPFPWSTYLFPPVTYAVYGARHLRRLKFDNSLAALRMWGFVLGETERLFRARQIGKKVVATMGDLGATPPLVLAGDALPFYPDCIWWVPFMNESTVLLDAAARLGIGESACYSRAALGAFAKQAYFPRPVLCIAATGASCDDYSGVEQLVADMGYPVHWFEMPLRKSAYGSQLTANGLEPSATSPHTLEFATAQFQALHQTLEQSLGRRIVDADLEFSIQKVNRVRRLMCDIKRTVYSAPGPVLPALETMVLEFGNLHFYSDIDEWTAILEHVRETVQTRAARQQYLDDDRQSHLRVVWVTPPADPLLLCFAEDLGFRVVGTEYVIAQALEEIPDAVPTGECKVQGAKCKVPNADGVEREEQTSNLLRALAQGLLKASLIGSSWSRARRVIEQAREHEAEGVVISGILGGSHCALETSLIQDYVREALDLPVLAFDVPAPMSSVSSQIRTRLEAFAELLRARR